MSKAALTHHDAVKAAVQELLRQGVASYVELSALSGRSRQIIRFWAQELGAEAAREEYLARIWREALRQNK